MSFASAATIGDRWQVFTAWAREEAGVRWMEDVSRETVEAYGEELAERVQAGEMSPAYAQNLVSAVNSVMTLATRGQWESVSPTRDCGIPERSATRAEAPGALDREVYTRAVEAVREQAGDRVAAIVELSRELGLRSKEASLIDAKIALREAVSEGRITVCAGTKGGRNREVPITNDRQLAALQRAAKAQGADRSMIPSGQTWREWREGTLRDARELLKNETGGGLHDLRAAYAVERYEALAGRAAPVRGGEGIDREAALRVAEELGHGRVEIIYEYIGR